VSRDVLFFDLDGTLIDSAVGITQCVAHALTQMGQPVPPQAELRRWIGPSLRTSFAPLFNDPAQVEQAVTYYRERFDVVGWREHEVYPRIGQVVQAFRDRGHRLAIVTAKNERRAVRKIWKRLEDALPIDVLCSLFPGRDGKYLISIPMSEEVQERIQRLAAAEQKTPEEYLQQVIAQALARDRSTRRAQLECSLNELLRTYSSEEVTGAVARRIRT